MGLYNESNGRAEEDTRTHKDDILPSVDANGGGRMTSPSQRQEDEGQNKQQTELAAAELSTISLGTDSAGVHHAEQAQRISVEKNTQRNECSPFHPPMITSSATIQSRSYYLPCR